MEPFDRIYSSHKELVWNVVSKYVFSKEEKEDLFQDVFLNIYKYLPTFRGESKIETWIYRITVNRSLNYVKKNSMRKKFEMLLERVGIFENKHYEEQQYDDVEDNAELYRPLEKLNPQQRMIFILSEVEEMKLADIADHLNKPIGTIKSNLFRAKKIIKDYIDKKGCEQK